MTLCFPAGHWYGLSAGAAVWGSGRQVSAEQQLADRQSGMTQWKYYILPSKLRGVGVVGAIVPDAGIGYIYAPFKEDKPVEWRFSKPRGQEQDLLIQAAFQVQLDTIADRIGGGIEGEASLIPLLGRAPTEIELEQVVAHAATAALPTQVALRAQAVEISCVKGTGVRTVGIPFPNLGQDPVRLLMITIDRLNAACLAQLRQTETK